MQLTNEQIKTKYFALASSNGVDKAVTALHREIGELEGHVFDGGYDVKRLECIGFMRELARELFTRPFTLGEKNNG